MSDKIKKDIIQKAWDITHEDNKIKKFYFFPWLISIIFLTLILVYQTIYTYVEIFHQEDRVLRVILGIFHSGYLLEILIGMGIFLLLYTIIIPLYEGTLISYIAKKHENQSEDEVSISDSFWKWLYNFLPLFEYGNIFSQFKFMSIINVYLFCLRFIGVEYIWYLTFAFLFLLGVSTVINILFAYARFEIVLNNKKALESINESIKIAILNIGMTTRLYFYMFLVNIRIIINFFVFLFFPFFIATAITYITTKVFLVITVIILSIIFFVLIVILGYLWGVFEILKTSIRYFAYIEGKKKLSDIEGEKKAHHSDEVSHWEHH